MYEFGIYVVYVNPNGSFDLFTKRDDGELILRDFGSKLQVSELAMMIVLEGNLANARFPFSIQHS